VFATRLENYDYLHRAACHISAAIRRVPASKIQQNLEHLRLLARIDF